MEADQVPQDATPVLDGLRKAVYARDASGRVVVVGSSGWEVEQTVTEQAVTHLHALASDALQRARAGQASSLEYWMLAQRMDLDLLAQSSGLWRWRVRRHLRPAQFAKLSPQLLARYAQALGLSVDQLSRLP